MSELIGMAAVGVQLAGFGALFYRLGQVHADFKHTVQQVTDHESRLRSLEGNRHEQAESRLSQKARR